MDIKEPPNDKDPFFSDTTPCTFISNRLNSNAVKFWPAKKHSAKRARLTHDSTRHLLHVSDFKSILRSPVRHLSDLIYIEHYENGGGYVLHAYADELSHLNRDELNLFVKKFFNKLFTERRKRGVCVPFSNYCIGIVHGAAEKIPELLSYLSNTYPRMIVHTNPLEQKNATESISLTKYASKVYESYSRGVYRFGPMHSISIVGVKGEERGHFSQDILNMIEADPFLRLVTPWGELSSLHGMDPHESDDGPIIWARHGEQSVPVCSSITGKRRSVEGASLTDLLSNRRIRRIRQVLVPDRTPCHADHADDGLGRHTTAAIGLLKAIYPPRTLTSTTNSFKSETQFSSEISNPGNWLNPYSANSRRTGRIIKDVVVFDPRHYPDLVKRLRLDIMEPPASQCGSFWADDGELNQLHSEGYSYARLPLRDNDIYFIPRNVVHQFKTISAGVSVAWHVRLQQYYDDKSSSSTATKSQPVDSNSGDSSTRFAQSDNPSKSMEHDSSSNPKLPSPSMALKISSSGESEQVEQSSFSPVSDP